jgi:hypothetical protein
MHDNRAIGGATPRTQVHGIDRPTQVAMRFLESRFDVFSRRSAASSEPRAGITDTLRNRVILLCRDLIGPTGYAENFWEEIHQKLEYLHGTPVLVPRANPRHRADDVLHFLAQCDSQHFLDFIEYIFQVDSFWRVNDKQGVVDKINLFLDTDDLPYFLTDYVEITEQGEWRGAVTTTVRVGAFPQVVLKEHRLTHAESVAPVLHLLTSPEYASANAEFLDALQDYRHRDYCDCLTKCGSAFESVMKVVCDKNKWPYKHTDIAATLIDTIVSRSGMEPFFTQPLMLIATLRNRLSKAHGAGTQAKTVSAAVAQFAVSATAAAILLIVGEARP